MIGPILGGLAALRYSGDTVNIVFDGNSLVAGNVMSSPSTQSLPAQLKQLAPLNGAVNVTNLGVGGQNINDMRARGAATDAAYVSGKRNILGEWETSNFVCNLTMTGQAAYDATRAWCADRLAAHPDWIIVLLTTIPRFDVSAGGWTVAQANAELLAYDALIKNNFRAMGAKAVVDVRAAGIFKYTGPTMDPAMQPYMLENIHYNPAGGALLAGYVASTLKRLPAR